jgi:hypothetical protein
MPSIAAMNPRNAKTAMTTAAVAATAMMVLAQGPIPNLPSDTS